MDEFRIGVGSKRRCYRWFALSRRFKDGPSSFSWHLAGSFAGFEARPNPRLLPAGGWCDDGAAATETQDVRRPTSW